MKKNNETTKDHNQNQNNLSQEAKKEYPIDKEESNQELKVENIKKSEIKEKELEEKSKILNKPKELLGFDAVAHFKENINHTDKNYLGPITEKSYYCLDCKHSECPLFLENMNQKEHLLIKRPKCLFYDKNFFDSVEKSINESLNYNQLKKDIKQCITNSIESLKNELDKVKENKFSEIDAYFDETDKYLLDLKNKYYNVKKSIEDYYKINKKFFNIHISKEAKNYMNTNTDTNTNTNSGNEIKVNSLTINTLNNNIQNVNIFNDEINNANQDIENTIFILNFEMMNLCETKNLEIMHYLKELKIKIVSFNNIIQQELIKNIDIISKFFSFEMKPEKIDDYYWDINLRTKKYSEMIKQFRETITEILHNTGNLEKIKDLIDIFDSKLKKNNNIIYGQSYFKDYYNETNSRTNRGQQSSTNERSPRKRNNSLGRPKSRTNSKSKLYSHRGRSANKIKKGENEPRTQLTKNNIATLTLSNDVGLMNIQQNKMENLKTESGLPLNTIGNLEHKKTAPISVFQKVISLKKTEPEDIILNQRVLERFFAYSISELFAKNFAPLDPDDESNYIGYNKDNIYLNRNRSKRPSLKSNTNTNNVNMSGSKGNKNKNRGNSVNKNNKNMINSYMGLNKYSNYNNYMKGANIMSNLKNSVGINNSMYNNINNNLYNNMNMNKIDPDKFDSNQYNIKSVSYLANYTNRYNSLKEMVKPIIGTNQIQLFTQNNQKIIRKTTNLNRDEHGYNTFPDGCRHILIEGFLYIIGGTNHVRVPINIVLEYEIATGIIKRLSDLNTPHSYHTVEYLDNYDSIVCIGGENSSSCEIMNLQEKKWYKLPNLNTPRANCNIYLNNINSELFVLFGICGIKSEKFNNYSDSIEVLVLNDISQGWIKVDYYKTPGLNLKVNYCMTIPFTRNQLLVYGGSNMRSFSQNIYALFHMIKNECNKVDTQTMELIKLEEKKSRLVDLALTKLG